MYWGSFWVILLTLAIFFGGLGEELLQISGTTTDETTALVLAIVGGICVLIGVVLGVYFCVVECQLRGTVRKQKNIDGGACGDFCCMLCCNYCSLIQMSKEYGMVVDRPGGDDFEVEIRIQQSQPVSSSNSVAPEMTMIAADMAMQSANSGVANAGFDGIEASAPPVYPVLSQ